MFLSSSGVDTPSTAYDRRSCDRSAAASSSATLTRPTRSVDGHEVNRAGAHYELRGARIDPAAQARMPILVGGNGTTLLRHAGARSAGRAEPPELSALAQVTMVTDDPDAEIAAICERIEGLTAEVAARNPRLESR